MSQHFTKKMLNKINALDELDTERLYLGEQYEIPDVNNQSNDSSHHSTKTKKMIDNDKILSVSKNTLNSIYESFIKPNILILIPIIFVIIFLSIKYYTKKNKKNDSYKLLLKKYMKDKEFENNISKKNFVPEGESESETNQNMNEY